MVRSTPNGNGINGDLKHSKFVAISKTEGSIYVVSGYN